MGRFETAWLTHETNLVALIGLARAPGSNGVRARRPSKLVILVYGQQRQNRLGDQDRAAYNPKSFMREA